MSLVLLFSAAVSATAAASADASVDAAVAAQVQLATVLASADAIDGVVAERDGIAFAIARGGEAYRVVATTRAQAVVAVLVTDAGRASAHPAGRLSWLARELAGAAASSIATLAVDETGAVIATTGAGTRYALIAGAGGNTAVAARWAAAWDAPAEPE